MYYGQHVLTSNPVCVSSVHWKHLGTLDRLPLSSPFCPSLFRDRSLPLSFSDLVWPPWLDSLHTPLILFAVAWWQLRARPSSTYHRSPASARLSRRRATGPSSKVPELTSSAPLLVPVSYPTNSRSLSWTCPLEALKLSPYDRMLLQSSGKDTF